MSSTLNLSVRVVQTASVQVGLLANMQFGGQSRVDDQFCARSNRAQSQLLILQLGCHTEEKCNQEEKCCCLEQAAWFWKEFTISFD